MTQPQAPATQRPPGENLANGITILFWSAMVGYFPMYANFAHEWWAWLFYIFGIFLYLTGVLVALIGVANLLHSSVSRALGNGLLYAVLALICHALATTLKDYSLLLRIGALLFAAFSVMFLVRSIPLILITLSGKPRAEQVVTLIIAILSLAAPILQLIMVWLKI